MKIVEARNLTDSELVSKKKDARQEHFNLRLQQTTGALEKPSRLNELRKDVAKLETVLIVNVPPFVGNGDKIKVDTSEARYIQRVQ